jgi:hypothetical protein
LSGIISGSAFMLFVFENFSRWRVTSCTHSHTQSEVLALKQHLANGMREAFKILKGKTFLVHQKQMHMTVEEDPYLNAVSELQVSQEGAFISYFIK